MNEIHVIADDAFSGVLTVLLIGLGLSVVMVGTVVIALWIERRNRRKAHHKRN